MAVLCGKARPESTPSCVHEDQQMVEKHGVGRSWLSLLLAKSQFFVHSCVKNSTELLFSVFLHNLLWNLDFIYSVSEGQKRAMTGCKWSFPGPGSSLWRHWDGRKKRAGGTNDSNLILLWWSLVLKEFIMHREHLPLSWRPSFLCSAFDRKHRPPFPPTYPGNR